MIVQRLTFSILAALTLGACAHVPPAPLKATAPTTLSAGPYRPHTLDEYPGLTLTELGRRMLRLIDSLTSFDELSLERVREVMRLPMHEMPSGSSHAFGMYLPASDWHYVLDYYDHPQLPESKNITYKFLGENETVDMGPVCAIDYNAYVAALQSMGFQEREDMAQYDALHLPLRRDERTGKIEDRPPQFRRLPTYFFTRNNVVVQIVRRRGADATDEKLRHACAESISIRRYGRD